MSRELPAQPNLEHLKKQAKELLRDFQQGSTTPAHDFAPLYQRPRLRLQNLLRLNTLLRANMLSLAGQF